MTSSFQRNKLTEKKIEDKITGTAIVYMSKHGTCNKIAHIIELFFKEDSVHLVDLSKRKIPDLSECSRIIVGGSIHMGKIQKEVQKFCEINKELLVSKPLGLFICCMLAGEIAVVQFNNAFSEELCYHAQSIAIMGYELNLEKMNFIEKLMTNKITGLSESSSQINYQQLNRFIKEMKL